MLDLCVARDFPRYFEMSIQRLILNTRLAGSSHVCQLHILRMSELLDESTAVCFPGMFELDEGKFLSSGGANQPLLLSGLFHKDMARVEYTVGTLHIYAEWKCLRL